MSDRVKFTALVLVLFFLSFESVAQQTIKVVYYNLLWYPKNHETRHEEYISILDELDPDILVVSEMKEDGLTPFNSNVMSQLSPVRYSQAKWHPDDESDIHLYFNSELFHLIGQEFIEADTRDVNEYILSYIDNPSITLHVLGAHLKASQGDENEDRRALQTEAYRNHMNTHQYDDRYTVFGGDFNFYDANEQGFQNLIEDGDDQLLDPIDQIGDWHVNSTFSQYHTQSTRISGFGAGGMDDRFDFIMVSKAIMEADSPVRYIEGSYVAWGNNGNILDKAINDESNDALSDDLLTALLVASDHLPVVMNLCIECDP